MNVHLGQPWAFACDVYGLRYHTHITKPDQVKTYHEQVGYWLWEPATGTHAQPLGAVIAP